MFTSVSPSPNKRRALRLLATLVIVGILVWPGAGVASAAESSATQTVAAELTAVAGGTIYIVKPGDTLAKIASRYGTTAYALASFNDIRNANIIYAGQRLVIPGRSVAPSPRSRVHVVMPGETLAIIAARYRTSIGVLARLNGIRNVNFIYVGQYLRIL